MTDVTGSAEKHNRAWRRRAASGRYLTQLRRYSRSQTAAWLAECQVRLSGQPEPLLTPEEAAVEDYRRAQRGDPPRVFTPPRKAWGTAATPADLSTFGEPPPEMYADVAGHVVVRASDGTQVVFPLPRLDKNAEQQPRARNMCPYVTAERIWRRNAGLLSGPPPPRSISASCIKRGGRVLAFRAFCLCGAH